MTSGSNLQAGEILKISLYALAHATTMFVLATAFYSIKPLRDKRALLTCGAMFYNAGNYGWTISSSLDKSSYYQIKIISTSKVSVYDFSE